MRTAPIPPEEIERLEELRRYEVLDTEPEDALDALISLVARLCDTPIALLSLVDEKRQWFKARVGLAVSETDRDIAFCSHAILDDEVMIVHDALTDERFHDNPLVEADPRIRFYAGAPLISPSGFRLGTLCAIDRKPRQLSESQIEALRSLARFVVSYLENRLTLRHLENAVRDRERSIEALQFLQQISTTPKARSLTELLGFAVDRILEITLWPFGEAWILDGGQLERTYASTAQDSGQNLLAGIAETPVTSSLVEGVWDSRIPAIVRDVESSAELCEVRPLVSEGIRSAVALPVLAGEEVVAVISFLMPRLSDADDDYVLFVDAVAAQLGTTVRHKIGEEKLRASEERYRDLFESASVLIQSVDSDGRFQYVNPAWHRALGFSADEIDGMTVFDVIHPDDRDHCGKLFGDLHNGASIENIEVRFRAKDGTTLNLLGHVSARLQPDGEIATRGIFRDITARKRAERALESSEAAMRSLFENMLGGLLVVDNRGRIRSANPAAERIFGYEPGKLSDRPIADLVPPTVTEPDSFLRESFRKAIGRVSEWEGRRRDGDVFPFELSLFTFETAEGRFVAGNIRDISERREIEQIKQSFVSTVSHELRTPLTAIKGALGLVSAGVFGALPEEAMSTLTMAERNTNRLMALVNDILDFEKLERGKMEMEKRPITVADLIRRAVESVAQIAAQSSITIDVGSTNGTVDADPPRIEQVLINLLSNALKFSSPGSTIRVNSETVESQIEISVTDEGKGIPPARAHLLFRPFQQLESGHGRKGGSGLGLAISRRIVEAHGGTIGVESHPGRGSRFWFRLTSTEEVLVK